MAGGAFFDIRVGKGLHGADRTSIDAALAAAQIINQPAEMVARNVAPVDTAGAVGHGAAYRRCHNVSSAKRRTRQHSAAAFSRR